MVSTLKNQSIQINIATHSPNRTNAFVRGNEFCGLSVHDGSQAAYKIHICTYKILPNKYILGLSNNGSLDRYVPDKYHRRLLFHLAAWLGASKSNIHQNSACHVGKPHIWYYTIQRTRDCFRMHVNEIHVYGDGHERIQSAPLLKIRVVRVGR